MKKFFTPVLFLVIAISFGCGYNPVIHVPRPKPYPSPSSPQMVAGMGQADLTLPPGYPMAGYSINGRISRGYWVRPKATALYLRDKAGTPFVFVTTDLWAITDGQKMAVLRALSKDPATDFIGESELLLAATHSHHSSGVIELDKAFTATSIGFGIDTNAFAFTIRQIVSAIKTAVRSAQVATVTYSVEMVDGIAKNRSDTAYYRNNPAERQQYLPPQKQLETNKFYRQPYETESAIDQWLTVITVKDTEGKIKGILASYPMHPTATGDATEVYSADVFGLASTKVSHEISDSAIVAFYNGAEGDVAPDYRFHQRSDAVRIADKLSQAIRQASGSGRQISLNGTISHRTKIIGIASNQTAINVFDTGCYEVKPPALVSTSARAVVGAAVFAGASDSRTSLSSFGISDGIRSEAWDAEQGHKMPAVKFFVDNVWHQILPKPVGYLAKKVVKIKPRPKLHISIHKVGDVYFVGLPGEFTTMLGRRIKKTIVSELKTKDGFVSLVGLADAYISYVTTPCEYEAQFYEGASDFFGISTGPVFVKEYMNLSQKGEDRMDDRPERKTRFRAGKVVKFGPEYLGELQTWNAAEGLHNLMVSANGFKVYFRNIPPINQARDTMQVEEHEIIAYSFPDRVNTIADTNFYPGITLQTASGQIVPLPEHILTVDKYARSQSTWTARILNTSSLAGYPALQVVVTPLSGTAPPRSGFFRVKGSGIR